MSDKSDSLIAAIEGNRSGMSKEDLILTCEMLERGRAVWRKEAEDSATELTSLKQELASLRTGVFVPDNSVESAKLVVREAASVLKGHAERMHSMASEDDYKSKTAALLTLDYVKKLAWVHDLLIPKDAIEQKKGNG